MVERFVVGLTGKLAAYQPVRDFVAAYPAPIAVCQRDQGMPSEVANFFPTLGHFF